MAKNWLTLSHLQLLSWGSDVIIDVIYIYWSYLKLFYNMALDLKPRLVTIEHKPGSALSSML